MSQGWWRWISDIHLDPLWFYCCLNGHSLLAHKLLEFLMEIHICGMGKLWSTLFSGIFNLFKCIFICCFCVFEFWLHSIYWCCLMLGLLLRICICPTFEGCVKRKIQSLSITLNNWKHLVCRISVELACYELQFSTIRGWNWGMFPSVLEIKEYWMVMLTTCIG